MKNPIKKLIKLWMGGMSFIAAVLLISTGAGAAAGQKDLRVSAEAACVMDLQSGTVLYDKNMNKKEYPASITKIMTTLVAMDNSSLSETVKYDDRAYTNWESRASNIGIVDGEKLSMEDSLYAIMLASANEVCNGVAIHVAGSIENYVAKMNEKAKELGCKNTHFMNPNGLWNKDHYTSPYDMALIGRAAMQNENFRTIASTKYYDIGKSNKRKYIDPMGNHHKMLNPGNMPQYGYKYCIGGKTGYTDKCRYTLVTFAKKGNMELVCVVMKVDGSPYMDTNAYTDTTKLFNYCFEKYDKTMIQDDTSNEINKEYLFTNFSPFYSKDTSSLHVDSDAGVILPKGVTLDKTEKKVTYLQTPEKQNGKNVIGHISYTYNGEDVGGADIYYDATDAATLKDSINMTEWFKEAEMTAKKEPFPVKKVMLIVILVICVAGLSCVCVIRIRGYQQKTEYRRRYRKARRHMRKRDRDFYTKR